MVRMLKCGTHTVEFYSAINKSEMVIFTEKYMELEIIILS